MSTYLSGGRPLELEIVKSSSSSARTTSTVSDSGNSQLAIATRKPRTPRKRPNQAYNEAAALLSTAYPAVFSATHLAKPHKSTKPLDSFWDPSSSDLLLPCRVIDCSGFLLHHPFREKPGSRFDRKTPENQCRSPGEIDSRNSRDWMRLDDDFDTESILDEEIEEGIIDSIMGMSSGAGDEKLTRFSSGFVNPLGLGFGIGVRRGVSPLRPVGGSNRWCSPIVDVLQISPRFNKPSPPPSPEKRKKRPEKRSTPAAPLGEISIAKASSDGKPLLLKLNYEDVVNAWSDRGSPFPEKLAGCDAPAKRKSKSKKISSLMKA